MRVTLQISVLSSKHCIVVFIQIQQTVLRLGVTNRCLL